MPTPRRNTVRTESNETVSPVPAQPALPANFTCHECGNNFPLAIQRKGIHNQEDVCLCAVCAERNYTLCSHCEVYFHNTDEHYTFNNSQLCEYCFNDEYGICEECGQYFHNENYSNHDGLCRACYSVNAVDTIQEYGAKAPMNFLGKKVLDARKQDVTRYFGAELECECGDENANKLAKFVRNTLGDFIITKRDGSLNNGFEIVTVPATFEIHKEKWKTFCDNKPTGLRSYDTETCGFHLHVSRKSLTTLQIGKIIVFLNKNLNSSLVEMIAGRAMNSYCQRKNKRVIDVLPKRLTGERREVVNLCNPHTIEFRMFKGTLNYHSLMSYFEFINSVISFCSEHSVIDSHSQNKYLDFMENHKYEFPYLYAKISSKWFERKWLARGKDKADLTAKYGFPVRNSSEFLGGEQ